MSRLIKIRGEGVVGEIRDGVFHKSAYESKHMLRKPLSWCFDKASIDNNLDVIKTVQISAKDTEKVYSISIERFFQYAGFLNRGYGEQYFVPIAHWSVTEARLPEDIPIEEAIQFKLF